MSDEAQKYYEDLAKQTKEIGGGGVGAGTIGRCRVETGWKVGAKGVPQGEAWFPCDQTDQKAVAVAKKAAYTLAKGNGAGGADAIVNYGIAIVMPRDQCFSRGEKVTWNTPELVRFSANFHQAFDEVVIPALAEQKIRLPFEGWIRVNQKADPHAVANDIKDDNDRYKSVYYVSEKFANLRLAKKAIAEMPKGDDTSDTPENYSADDWAECLDDIKTALDSQTVEQVAESYDVDVHYIQSILDEIVPV